MQLSHLLMIEDDARLAVMVGEYLERSGYSFEHAAEGGEGLRRVQQRLPDLVILDLMLPGADGLELCRQLRAQALFPSAWQQRARWRRRAGACTGSCHCPPAWRRGRLPGSDGRWGGV